MKEAMYGVLRKLLKPSTRKKIRNILRRGRSRMALFYRLRYGTFTAADLGEEIVSKVGHDFDILMVHASTDALFPMYTGKVFDLVDVLLSMCSPDKTLAMPAFFFGGRENDVLKYYEKNRIFDVKRLPSQAGLLSEMFRRRPGVKASLHPTHRICAFGPVADELVKNHHSCPTACGQGTPFDVMASSRTVILGIGIEYVKCLTQVHAVEDLLGDKFPVTIPSVTVPVTLINEAGDRFEYKLAVPEIIDRRLDILRTLLTKDELVEWKYRGVPLFFTTAKRVTNVLSEAALKGTTIYTGF